MSTKSSSSIPQMISESRAVLTSPSVATFERYEKSGNLTDALIYVAIAAAVSGVFGLAEGFTGFLRNVVGALIGFLVFTYLVHFFGKQRGGTGTMDEVAYSFALFWVPISVLTSLVTLVLVITVVGVFILPLVAIAALVLNIYFANLAVQSSMNLQAGGSTWLVLILAAVVAFVVNLLVAAILP